MTDEAKVRPHWKVVALDETLNWLGDLPKRAGRIWGTYLFDQKRHVHACELTPSYELHFIESVSQNRLSDADDEALRFADSDSDQVRYFHCGFIDGLAEDRFHDLGVNPDSDDDYEDELEGMLEYVRCNACHPRVTWAR